MAGEENLEKLLKSMSPELLDEEFVFCSFENASYGDHAELQPIASIVESEGLTLVIPKQTADNENLAYDSVFRGITLTAHSSLDAIGLTSAFSSKLADYGISANVIAGFYHDHIFVPRDDADSAIEVLKKLVD